MLTKRFKAMFLNFIFTFLGLAILGCIMSVVDNKLFFYNFAFVGLIILNLIINVFVHSPGYYLCKLRFDNKSFFKKIKILIVNLIQNLFFICILINATIVPSKFLMSNICPILLIIYFINFIYLSISRSQTLLERIFKIDLLEF